MYHIYVLSDRDGAVRYVGTTSRKLSVRRAWHTCVARRGSTIPVAAWIRDLLKQGRRPRIERLFEHENPGVAASIETAWISFLRATGYDLLNVNGNGYVPTPEHRRAISNAMRGRRPSRRTRVAMSAAARLAWRQRRAQSITTTTTTTTGV